MRNLWLGLGPMVAVTVAGCGGGPPTGADGEPLPDVVLILIDTLRPDHLPFYGYDTRDTAPFLAGLAADSVVFRHAFSTSSWTAPSTASVFTSLYPPQHGVVEGFFAHKRRADEVEESGSTEIPVNRLAGSVPTLPAFFREAGYRTLGLAANVNIGEEIGFDRGFDLFERVRSFEDPKNASAEELEARLLEWLPERDPEQPTFLYLHFNDVHYPYARHKPWYERQADELEDDRAGYDSEVRYVDEALRRIFERYRFDEDAVVMLVSDHGQEFLEHGRKGHKTQLYRELVQVLMMVHAPWMGIEPGQVDVNTSLIDVLPTLVDLAGIGETGEWEGRSLVPLLERRPGAVEDFAARTLFAHRVELGEDPIHLFAAIRGTKKLIQSNRTTGIDLELYDFVEDPLETTDREEGERDLVQELLDEIRRFQTLEPKGTGEVYRFHLDEESLKHLQDIGYVEGAEEG